jgi:hypothetical protein
MDRYGYSPGGAYGGVPYPPTSVARPRDAGGWRQPIAVMLVVLGCLIAPVALAGLWLHVNIMDVDGYVATITPVADEPAVQKAVADVLTNQVYGALDVNQILQGSLPPGLDFISGPLGAQLENLTRKLTEQAVASSAFRGFWAAANRRVHPILIKAIKSKGRLTLGADGLVSLDLVEVTKSITDLLAASGVALPDVFPEALTNGNVVLLDSRPLARAGAVILALDALYWLLPVVVLAFLLGAVLVASKRLRTAIYTGVGLVLAMAALEAGVAVGRAYYLRVTDDAGIPHDASAAMWRVVTSSLRLWGWAVLVVGVAVALAATAVLLITRRSGPRPQQAGPGYPGAPGGPGYPGGPQYPGGPAYPGGPQYPAGPGYPGGPQYPAGPGYAGPTGPPPSR